MEGLASTGSSEAEFAQNGEKFRERRRRFLSGEKKLGEKRN